MVDWCFWQFINKIFFLKCILNELGQISPTSCNNPFTENMKIHFLENSFLQLFEAQ